MRLSFAAAAVAVAVALTLSACGGGSSSSQLGGGASVIGVDTQAYLALDTSISPGAADQLMSVFPGQSPLVARLSDRFETLRPALGKEVDLALNAGGATAVLARPEDPAQVAQLLGTQSKKLGGWTAFGDSTTLAGFTSTAALTPLAKDPLYLAAMTSVPSGAVARAYASKTTAATFLGALPGQTQLTTGVPGRRARPPAANQDHVIIAEDTPEWASASIVDAHGVATVATHVHFVPPSENLIETASLSRLPTLAYTPHLLDEIPAGAIFAADLPVSQSEFEVDTGSLAQPLQALLTRNSDLGSGLDYVLNGETALYLRPSLPIPEITIVSQPLDTLTAEQALHQSLGQLRGDGGIFAGLHLYDAVLGGELVISTTKAGIAAFRGNGPKLSADPTFTSALKAAGIGSTTTGLVYADLRQADPLVRRLAALLGVTAPAGGAGVTTLLAYAARANHDARYTVSLQLR